MKTMKFTKMQGLGNDYVYVDCTKVLLDNPSEIAIKVSDRHFGIGSDGLILIKSSDKADFYMEMYNADGSRSAMCGNGIRCVGKYVYDFGLTDKTEVAIDTAAGIKYLSLNVEDGKVKTVKVNMGAPIFEPAKIPVTLTANAKVGDEAAVIAGKMTVLDKEYEVTCVSMGNPHVITYVENEKAIDIEKIGPAFESNEVFPERTNTEFIRIADRNNLYMRVWERGSGETLACGTGACATAVATVLNGMCNEKVTVHLLGGDLEIEWDRDANVVYMTGPAVTVYNGEIELE